MNSKTVVQKLIRLLTMPTRSLSAKLNLSILLMAAPIFIVSLGVLLTQSRHIIRKEAVGRANSVLTNNIQQVHRKIAAVETATHNNYWLALQPLQPDSLLALTYRIVRLNPHVDGCSISAEPDVFPEYGRYFSVYSIREQDSIVSVVEEQYEYFVKNWYKKPHDLDEPCWVNFYDETDSLEVALEGMIASYGVPIHDDEGKTVAIISTDISLRRLSKTISDDRPYPNSYFIMLDEDGRYIIHPESSMLFSHTIFDSPLDPKGRWRSPSEQEQPAAKVPDGSPSGNSQWPTANSQQTSLIALGHEMTEGNNGNMAIDIDGKTCLVCYQHVPGTQWSMAIICPESDILQSYRQLSYIIIPLLVIGLLLIMVLSHRAVAHAIRPLNPLLEKTQTIASGNMEVHIQKSQRQDAVGKLQNSFATMLQALNFHMGSVRYTTELAQRRNEQLAEATRMAQEADKQKAAFIQNVTHQIRTPLNIIMGFAQVLNDTQQPTTNTFVSYDGNVCQPHPQTPTTTLTEQELHDITSTMKYNAALLNRIVQMLFDSSETGTTEETHAAFKKEAVPCNEVAREAVSYVKANFKNIDVDFQTEINDNFCIHTNRTYLMRSIREILYNSAKYSDQKHVALRIEICPPNQPKTIRFIVEDKGKGIDKDDREMMFKFFTKVDDLSEGLGLGLPLAKRHVQNLGGDLILDEDYHDGCRFIVEIALT